MNSRRFSVQAGNGTERTWVEVTAAPTQHTPEPPVDFVFELPADWAETRIFQFIEGVCSLL